MASILLYNACSAKIAPSHNNLDLIGTWSITKIGTQVVPEKNEAIFMFDQNGVSATIGCNDHSSLYKVERNNIRFSELIWTEMFCQNLNDLEQAMQTHLLKTTQYKFENGSLLLKDTKGNTTFVLKKQAETTSADADLKGTWSITKIGSQVISDNKKAKFTLQDTQLGATIGCNTHSGTYKVEGQNISISRLRSTLMHCPDLSELESKMNVHLVKTTQFKLNKNTLFLMDSLGNNTLFLTRLVGEE